MVREIDPKQSKRAAAYRLWMDAPNPMVTFMKTLDVTNLVRVSRWRELNFNMLLCWCIGRATVEVYAPMDPRSPDYESGIWMPIHREG